MANFCEFKFEIRGKKNACYAFLGSTSAEDHSIDHESGTEENYVIQYSGSCKYFPDAYCKDWEGDTPVAIPADAKAAFDEAYKYIPYNLQSRSKMFGIEALCNYCDIDGLQEAMEYTGEEFDFSEGIGDSFEHYLNGERIEDNCPDDLLIYVCF